MLELLDQTSGLLIAIVGGVFTYFYNRRQHELVGQRDRESERLQLLEATEKMIPHFHGDTKEIALVALSNLAGSPKLILSLAELYPGRAAAVACLEILDQQGDARDLSLVRRTLFSSLYTAAGEIGERGVIELLAERLPQDELRTILNETDPQGRTAVMNAAKHNRGGNIQKLAGLGARIDIVDDGGETALHHAAREGRQQATKVLVDLADEPEERRKAFVGDKDAFFSQANLRDGWTALDLALYQQSRQDEDDLEGIKRFATVVKRLERAGVAHGPGRPCDDGLSTAPPAQSRVPRTG